MRLLSMVLLCLIIACSPDASKQEKPNVVVILIDNMGYFELSRNGNPIVQTPRIDQLSKQAVNFTNFYAPPFCSPSRTELLTGRYALRAGVHNTIGGVSILHKKELTLAEILRQEGYQTAIFGKWHLGSSYPYAPQYRGFEEVFVHGGGGVSQLGDYYGNDHIDATFEHNGTFVKTNGFSTDILFDEAIKYIESNKEDQAPFFCYISTPAVHFPTNRHPVTTQRLLERGVEDSKFLALYSMIENVDANMGKFQDYLEQSGLKNNTLVILASDQGVNDRGAVRHRSGKFQNRGLSYDEKHHVFAMIQYPELTDRHPGDRNDLAGMVDVLPTILDICDIEQPSSLDGQSLQPILSNSTGWNADRSLIIQCPRSRYRKKWQNTSVKKQTWRLVDGKELYNIKDDFGQKMNVASKFPQIVAELSSVYDSFWHTLDPPDSLISAHILGADSAPEVRLVAMDWYQGDAPWTQQSLKHKSAQGKWRIEVVHSGNYRFELRRYPREAPKPIEAISAAIKIGDSYTEKNISLNESEVFLELLLSEGIYDMQTTFKPPADSAHQTSWGANYVHISMITE